MISMASQRLQTASPYLIGAAASLSSYFVLRSILSSSQILSPKDPPIIQSPLQNVFNLSTEEIERLPYPPNALPGARDVLTPYGSIRVYEFGPTDGRKVVFLHGISTPCVSGRNIAQALVEKGGARVMLFGEWFMPFTKFVF
jgi:hypothetical protein